MKRASGRVLDVGNCDHDHSLIREMLTTHFNVSIDRAATIADAMRCMAARHYDLVLFNRMIDADGSEGIDLVRRAKADDSLAPVPIMMVSNFADAQEACLAAGGVRGFGKAALKEPATIALLAEFLPRK